MTNLAFAIIAMFLFSTYPAWALEELNAYLPLSGEPVTPQFEFSKKVILDYPNGGKLKNALEGRNLAISFEENSYKNPSVKELMERINSNLQGTTKVTYLVLDYSFVLTGGKSSATFDYDITLIPMISGYVISNGTQTSPAILDASWIGLGIKGPVVINSQKYGYMEINFPSSLLKRSFPDVYSVLAETDAQNVFENNIVAANLFSSAPLDRWDRLFDPAYTLSNNAGFTNAGLKVAVTTFATGVSSMSSGISMFYVVDRDFVGSDGTKYHVSVLGGPDSGTIDVEGHVIAYLFHGQWAFVTVPQAASPTCCSEPWFEAPLVWVGIVAGTVGGFFILYFRRSKE